MRWFLLRCAVLIVVGTLCVSVTRHRVQVWHSELLLWTEATQVSPEKPRPWVNLGNQYSRLEADTLAETAYHRALRAASRSERSLDELTLGRAIAANNLARVHMAQGRPRDALRLVSEAQALVPSSPAIERTRQWIARDAAIAFSH